MPKAGTRKYNIKPDDTRKKAGNGEAGRQKVKEMLQTARRVGVKTKQSKKDDLATDAVLDADESEYEEESQSEEEEEEECEEEEVEHELAREAEELAVEQPKPKPVKTPRLPRAGEGVREPRLTKKDLQEVLEQKFRAELEAQMKNLSEQLKFNTIRSDYKQHLNMCKF